MLKCEGQFFQLKQKSKKQDTLTQNHDTEDVIQTPRNHNFAQFCTDVVKNYS